ncbi:hypothetical protein EYF80_006685 [Liparis tanakae]|uniref:Uncharacterized protein n=1 Tax=Liparis tanakae TaxID=230148 RepID=A0A4Z2J074_9TELE|nr:hypothetical protein EYF80_006685 [Liparis tanakae]
MTTTTSSTPLLSVSWPRFSVQTGEQDTWKASCWCLAGRTPLLWTKKELHSFTAQFYFNNMFTVFGGRMIAFRSDTREVIRPTPDAGEARRPPSHSGSYRVLRENADSCDCINKMVQSDDTFAESACLTRRGSRPLLEMQIIRDHLVVPDTGRAKLWSTSQRQPSNTLCPYPSGHPHTASLFSTTSPRPPTQTLSPWMRPQANGEQGAPEWALDWPLSGPTAESLYLHSL